MAGAASEPGRAEAPGTKLWWRLAIAACWLLAATLYLQLPPKPDQFDHGYVAWRLLHGAVPYRDFVDVNWPGVFALHAASLLLFGVHMWSWRAFDLLMLVPTVWCLADLGRMAAGARAGRITLALAPLMYAAAGYWIAGQKDMSAAQLLACALWFHVTGYLRRDWRWQVGTGFLLALAMLNKPTTGVMLALLPMHAGLHGRGLRTVCGHTLVTATALALAIAASAVGVVLLGAAVDEIAEALFVYTRFVVAEESIAGFVALRGPLWLGLFAACVPVWLWIFRRASPGMPASSLFVLWVAGWLSAVAQHRGHGYHLSAVYLAMMGALPLALALAAGDACAPRRHLRLALALWAVVALTLAVRLAWQYGGVAAVLAGGDRNAHLQHFQAEVDAGLTMADVARFVRRLDEDPDRSCVFFVGQSSAINLLAQRPQPTRFYYLPVIQNANAPLPMAARWQQAWSDELARADCRYVLVSSKRNADWLQGGSEPAQALRRFLARYQPVETLGPQGAVQVYRRSGA